MCRSSPPQVTPQNSLILQSARRPAPCHEIGHVPNRQRKPGAPVSRNLTRTGRGELSLPCSSVTAKSSRGIAEATPSPTAPHPPKAHTPTAPPHHSAADKLPTAPDDGSHDSSASGAPPHSAARRKTFSPLPKSSNSLPNAHRWLR